MIRYLLTLSFATCLLTIKAQGPEQKVTGNWLVSNAQSILCPMVKDLTLIAYSVADSIALTSDGKSVERIDILTAGKARWSTSLTGKFKCAEEGAKIFTTIQWLIKNEKLVINCTGTQDALSGKGTEPFNIDLIYDIVRRDGDKLYLSLYQKQYNF